MSGPFALGARVIYPFPEGTRRRSARQEIECEVVDGRPFSVEGDRGRERLAVRCVEGGDAMNGIEFIPFVDRLRLAATQTRAERPASEEQ